ncbi:transposase [Lentzea sp. NEAU-D13]|uniref:Transposase n=1 Tax=Lentzea alba TaxID=2714351 RepID=A0A7C9RRI1_9PSEU|nr:RNA-guided endonuclease TnpB family protein [Lentzea alba]NGY61150.1 transposase [Lentzea alba]
MNGQVRRAFKFRFCPTEAQAAELSRTFGCVRKVYNLALQARTEAWTQRGDRIGYEATSALLTAWKRTEELAFLGEVSSVPLQQALRHLQTGFANFFAKRARYPRFKSRKKSRLSAEYTRSAFRWRDGTLALAKMVEPLNIRWSRSLPAGAVPSTVTVSRDAVGRWFVSLSSEDPSVTPLPTVDSVVGIDVGLDHLAVLSTGEKIRNPRHERRDRMALARAQRALCRKQKGSNNRDRARVKVARVHARIADRRTDYLHKITTRWFPSSKLCSVCGALAAAMPLHARVWTCGCGATHDRDVNAARNILAAGLAVTVCGADVRPQRNPPGGRSAAKQKAPRREP